MHLKRGQKRGEILQDDLIPLGHWNYIFLIFLSYKNMANVGS